MARVERDANANCALAKFTAVTSTKHCFITPLVVVKTSNVGDLLFHRRTAMLHIVPPTDWCSTVSYLITSLKTPC